MSRRTVTHANGNDLLGAWYDMHPGFRDDIAFGPKVKTKAQRERSTRITSNHARPPYSESQRAFLLIIKAAEDDC